MEIGYSDSVREPPPGCVNRYPFGLQMPGRGARAGSGAVEDFTGHELDPETGLHYAGARYYMSALGRWGVTDPLAGDYPAYSPYNYTLNNPITLIDPTGACPEDGSEGDAGDGDGYCLAEITVEAERDSDPWQGWGLMDLDSNGDGEPEGKKFVFDASTQGGSQALHDFLMQSNDLACGMVGNASFSMDARSAAMAACIHSGQAASLDWAMNHPAMIAMTLPIGSIGRGGVSAFRMYRSALQLYKTSALTRVGVGLTKHPGVVGLTKQNLRNTLRLDPQINLAAQTALKNMMRTGVRTMEVVPRFGRVIQYRLSSGYGARFYADTGKFIGFIDP